MRTIPVKPKNGWAHATKDELNKSACNIIGQRHCLNPNVVYEYFNKYNICAADVFPYLIGKENLLKANIALLQMILSDEPQKLYNIIKDKRSHE